MPISDFTDFKTSDGVTLRYYDEGEGTPVVLMGGYSASAQTWFYQKAALLKAGYRVIGLNQRFHGFSESPNHGFRLSRIAADLKEFIDFLNIGGTAVVVGQSMGASALLCYISLFGDGNLKAIVTVDQTPQMICTEAWPHGMYGLNKETMATFFDVPLPNPLYSMPPDYILAEVARIQADEPAFDLALTKPLLLDHAYASWLDVLPLVKVPALFMAGAKSPFWPCAHAEEMAKRVQNARACIVGECGHPMNWEKPDEFNEKLLAFLAEI